MTARTMLLATFGIALFSSAAEARPRPNGHLTGRRFEANKTFGLGLELGTPTGLTGKYFFAEDRALDFGFGDNFADNSRSGVHIYADYLFHPVSVAWTEDFEVPFFIGVGGRFWNFEDHNTTPDTSANAFGVRVPIGFAMDFNNIPLDVFLQFVPVLDFFSNFQGHSVDLDFDISVGARYWFD